MTRPIGVAADHGGKVLKSRIRAFLTRLGFEVVDFGVEESSTASVDYPDYAKLLCEAILAGRLDSGILICGSGIGMSIAANRYPGIRAALVWSTETAALAKQHNHANVLCLGERVLNHDEALSFVETWLSAVPETRHKTRIEKLDRLYSSH